MYSQKREILNSERVIQEYSHDREVTASYSIPFKVVLPVVPVSFHESDPGGKFKAQIMYTISAICTPLSGLGDPVSCSEVFEVEVNMKQEPFNCRNDTFDIKSWFFISRGTCKMGLISTGALRPGDVLGIDCDISNESTIDIKHIELSIKKDFKVRANGHEHVYSREVAMSRHEGVSKESKSRKKLLIDVPVDLTPTVVSRLIGSNYRIEVKLVMNGFGAKDVMVDMPLTVAAPPSLGRGQNPKTLKLQEFRNGLEQHTESNCNKRVRLGGKALGRKRPFVEMERGRSERTNINVNPPKRQRKEKPSPPRQGDDFGTNANQQTTVIKDETPDPEEEYCSVDEQPRKDGLQSYQSDELLEMLEDSD